MWGPGLLQPRLSCALSLICVCVQVSEDLAPNVHDAYILKEITGSDHVPLGIVIKKS